MNVKLTRSPNPNKKYRVSGADWHVDFGAKGYSDYTLHKDSTRRDRYIIRHRSRENWGPGGVRTAGFWSRWLLWEKPNLQNAKKHVYKRFKIKIN